jgi:hypothetical protein
MKPRTVSHDDAVLLSFAWLLSFPTLGDVDGLAYRIHCVTPCVMVSLITFVKVLIKNQIH